MARIFFVGCSLIKSEVKLEYKIDRESYHCWFGAGFVFQNTIVVKISSCFGLCQCLARYSSWFYGVGICHWLVVKAIKPLKKILTMVAERIMAVESVTAKRRFMGSKS